MNRTLLARQHLLERARLSAYEMLEHLVGMQAQVPTSPYVGLWSRIEGFATDDLASLLLERRAVRLVLMRSTIHLVTDRDALAIRPIVQSVLDKTPGLAAIDRDALTVDARALVEASPRTPAELGDLFMPARALLALVQVPPRGVWGAGGAVRLTTAESWLGRPLGTDADHDPLVVRYLRAFGPASAKDFSAWSRLTGVRTAFERLRPHLRTYRDEHGVELFDVDDGVITGADTPAPVRFLPEYDNVILGHADRSRIIDERARSYLSKENGYRPFVIADGVVCATWTAVGGFEVTPFDGVDARTRRAIDEEAERVRAFVGARLPG